MLGRDVLGWKETGFGSALRRIARSRLPSGDDKRISDFVRIDLEASLIHCYRAPRRARDDSVLVTTEYEA